MAYLIIDQPSNTYIFTGTDPRNEGYRGPVQERVALVEEYPEIQSWPEGKPPGRCVGVSPKNRSEFRVFPSMEDCRSAGFTPLTTNYWTGDSWQDWLRSTRA